MPSKYSMNIKTGLSFEDRLLAFYAGSTCLYFAVLISALVFTSYIYSVGRLSFYPVIGLIAVLECMKYIFGVFHIPKKDGFLGKNEEKFYACQRKKAVTKAKMKEVCNCVLILSTMLAVYFVVAILFGAELFSKHEETFMFSLMLTVLTILPPCLHLDSQSVVNLLFGVYPVGDVVGFLLQRNMYFTLAGAWFGAFVIPLDWDRPWQEWPIPCSTGALLGYFAGNFQILLSLLPSIARKQQKINRKLR